jgi:hypothetical protein
LGNSTLSIARVFISDPGGANKVGAYGFLDRHGYNTPVTNDDIEHDATQEQAPELPVEEPTGETPPVEPTLPVFPARSAATRSYGGTNIGRWASFGCLAVMIILVVVLVIGVGMTKRTVWIAVARAQQRLIQDLPRDLSSGDRLQIERNLQRFRARLELQADPLPLMGEFLNRVQAAFADDELSTDEVADFNFFFESVIDGDGEPSDPVDG